MRRAWPPQRLRRQPRRPRVSRQGGRGEAQGPADLLGTGPRARPPPGHSRPCSQPRRKAPHSRTPPPGRSHAPAAQSHGTTRRPGQQARSSTAAGFAAAAAKSLRPVPALRKRALGALRSTGAAEVTVTPEQVLALPGGGPYERSPAGAARAATAARHPGPRPARQQQSPTRCSPPLPAGGPTLIEPLADSARTRNLEAIAAELGERHSKSARRSPISRTRGKPRRFRPASHDRRGMTMLDVLLSLGRLLLVAVFAGRGAARSRWTKASVSGEVPSLAGRESLVVFWDPDCGFALHACGAGCVGGRGRPLLAPARPDLVG